jgi:hypothetical protein
VEVDDDDILILDDDWAMFFHDQKNYISGEFFMNGLNCPNMLQYPLNLCMSPFHAGVPRSWLADSWEQLETDIFFSQSNRIDSISPKQHWTGYKWRHQWKSLCCGQSSLQYTLQNK